VIDASKPSEYRLSVIQRSIADAAGLVGRGDFDHEVPGAQAAKGMASEMARLKARVDILYLTTTVGSFLIFTKLGHSTIESFGIHLAVDELSKPLISVLLAGAYQQLLSNTVSYTLLMATFRAIFFRIYPDGWEYLGAQYNADLLWMALTRPREGGYVSPRWERGLSIFTHVPNQIFVISQTGLVLFASIFALTEAISSHNWVSIILCWLAAFVIVSSVIAFVLALYFKVSYRPVQAALGEKPV